MVLISSLECLFDGARCHEWICYHLMKQVGLSITNVQVRRLLRQTINKKKKKLTGVVKRQGPGLQWTQPAIPLVEPKKYTKNLTLIGLSGHSLMGDMELGYLH